MKKYKLAILISHPIQYYYPLYQELAAHPQIDLTVYFCWKGGVEEGGTYERGFDINIKWDLPLLDGYDHIFLKNYARSSPPSFWGLINPGIIRELYSHRYDAIFVWGYYSLSNWLAFLGAGLTRTPVFLGGSVVLAPRISPIKNLIKKVILTPLFKRVSAFMCECEKNAEFYQYYGATPENTYWNPAAVNNRFFQDQAKDLFPRKDQIKKNLNISENSPVILFLGRLTPRKRVRDILMAFQDISDETNATVLIVGSGDDRDNLERFVQENNMDRVIFTGFKNQTKLPTYYTIADVFVVPSQLDPSPRVINEAMNYGLPIIVSNRVGSRGDLVQDGKNGFVFPVGDVGALSRTLRKILLDPDLRRKMGESSREIIDKWTYQTGIKEILKALSLLKPESD
jgi:glycosyltransferase involved in cell wall biosynthesis